MDMEIITQINGDIPMTKLLAKTKARVQAIIDLEEGGGANPLNHGYLWAIVQADGKKVRDCLGYGCPGDWQRVQYAVSRMDGVVMTWVSFLAGDVK